MIQSLDYTNTFLRIVSILFWPVAIVLLATSGSVHAQTAESHSFMLIGGMEGSGGPDLVSPSFRLEAESFGQAPITWTLGTASSSVAPPASPPPIASAANAVSSKPVAHGATKLKLVIQPVTIKKPIPTPVSVPRPPTISGNAAATRASISTPSPSPSAHIQARVPTWFSIWPAKKTASAIERMTPIQSQLSQTAGESADLPRPISESFSWSLSSLLSSSPFGLVGGNDGAWLWIVSVAGAFATGASLPRIFTLVPLVQGWLQRPRPIRPRRRRRKR